MQRESTRPNLQQSLHLRQTAVVDRLVVPKRLAVDVALGGRLLPGAGQQLGVEPQPHIGEPAGAVVEHLVFGGEHVVADRRQHDGAHRHVEHPAITVADAHPVVGPPHDQPPAVGEHDLLPQRFAPVLVDRAARHDERCHRRQIDDGPQLVEGQFGVTQIHPGRILDARVRRPVLWCAHG
jgi:hypothetical protein